MAVSWVQDTSASQNGITSVNVSFGSNNTAGNFLFCAVNVYDNEANPSATTWTISDTQGNTWTLRNYEDAYNGVNQTCAAIWTCENCASGANSVTVSGFTTNSFASIVILECTGPDTSGAFDTGLDNTGSTTSVSSGSVTSTQADTFWFSFMCHDSGNPTITPSQTQAEEQENGSSFMPFNAQYEVRSTTATQAHTWTLGTGVPWYATVAVAKQTGGGGVSIPVIMAHLRQQKIS